MEKTKATNKSESIDSSISENASIISIGKSESALHSQEGEGSTIWQNLKEEKNASMVTLLNTMKDPDVILKNIHKDSTICASSLWCFNEKNRNGELQSKTCTCCTF